MGKEIKFTPELIERVIENRYAGPGAFVLWRKDLRDAVEGDPDAQAFVQAIGPERLRKLAEINDYYAGVSSDTGRDVDWFNNHVK